MKCVVSLLLIMLSAQICHSQLREGLFSADNAKLDLILFEIERQFAVKYSYSDSIIASKTITLSSRDYTLQQLNDEISRQCFLIVIKIDDRYYALYENDKALVTMELVPEVLVQGFLSKGIRKVQGNFVILPQKVEELPGVTDADLMLSLQQLPGVKSPNETASGLHVRGGTPDQNLIMWDGIRMYHPGHLFGMISGFNPNVDQVVNYYNKGSNPKFGERLSSVIDIRPTDKIADSLIVSAGINALNADIYLRAPLVRGKLGIQLSGRKSFTEWIQTSTFNALTKKVFQNTNFKDFDDSNIFRYQDYSGKINYEPNANSQFSLTAIAIDNYLDFTSKAGNADRQNQEMTIMNHGYGFNWNQKYSARLKHKFLLYYSAYTFDYIKIRESNESFDQFAKLNRIIDSGSELNFSFSINEKWTTDFGYQLLGNDVSHSFKNKTADFEINLDSRRLYNITHAGYLFLKYTLKTWDFKGGARYNYFNALRSDSFEPRIFISKKLNDQFTLELSYERRSQVMSQVRESAANDLSLENYVWILADDVNYPIQKADQFTLGMIYKKGSWLLDADFYYKKIAGVTSLTFGFLNQLDPLVRKGDGFTKGVDFLIQKSTPSWRAWLTYTYQDSQNRYTGINGDRYFPINGDITHAVSASFHKKWKSFTVAMGWFWHSGKPYSLLNTESQIVVFNKERLPVYHRLDLSAAYQFYNKKSWSGKVGLSVLNAYNRQTVISREYEREYSSISDVVNSNYTLQDYYSTGITPNVFIRVNF